jgi:hypothetical protein
LGDVRVRLKGRAVKDFGLVDRTESFTPDLRGVKDVWGMVKELFKEASTRWGRPAIGRVKRGVSAGRPTG